MKEFYLLMFGSSSTDGGEGQTPEPEVFDFLRHHLKENGLTPYLYVVDPRLERGQFEQDRKERYIGVHFVYSDMKTIMSLNHGLASVDQPVAYYNFNEKMSVKDMKELFGDNDVLGGKRFYYSPGPESGRVNFQELFDNFKLSEGVFIEQEEQPKSMLESLSDPNFIQRIRDSALKYPITQDGVIIEELRLPQGGNKRIVLTAPMCVSIMSSILLRSIKRVGESYPDLHYDITEQQSNPWDIAKLNCIVQYLWSTLVDGKYITQDYDLTIERNIVDPQQVVNLIQFKVDYPLSNIVFHNKSIEDIHDSAHVDFANLSLGGGVLTGGMVQEEIMFAQRPMLIAAMACVEFMSYEESIIIRGAVPVSKTTGYAKTFKYVGPEDNTLDPQSQVIIAIDSTDMRSKSGGHVSVNTAASRDVIKAYSGFSSPLLKEMGITNISTGNWGCGAFMCQMKTMIPVQLIASTLSGITLTYSLFGKDLPSPWGDNPPNSIGEAWNLSIS
jgi:hypothetical protein